MSTSQSRCGSQARAPGGLLGLVLVLLVGNGCTTPSEHVIRTAEQAYPPPPPRPHAVALGNLYIRSDRAPGELGLARVIFGSRAASAIVRPAALAADGPGLLICDGAPVKLVRWQAASGVAAELRLGEALADPVDLDVAPNGDWLITDVSAGAVLRFNPRGDRLVRYKLDGAPFRPAGAVAVGDEVWVSNVAAHRLDVFEAVTGRHRRGLGARGDGPGQFGMPLGLARSPEGHVYVVDMLNNRVQVLDGDGNWLRSIGSAGNRVGHFGRPKDVAVGPDGTTFVTDAASQRVHAFDGQGRPLLAFGADESGARALRLPGALAVLPDAPQGGTTLPRGFTASYYVVVAEQLAEPGLRVYAWGLDGSREASVPRAGWPVTAGSPTRAERGRSGDFVGFAVPDPHWRWDRCNACHELDADRPLPIAPEAVDSLCLWCHDGRQAPAELHPVGGLATGPQLALPDHWPAPNGRIGCLTCHDIRQQCEDARRPTVNAALLRQYNPSQPLRFCTRCHVAVEPERLTPHRQLDPAGRVRAEVCLVCHTEPPVVPSDGIRRFEPKLREASSGLCLRCHARHWDVSARGHVDRPVPEHIRRRLLATELLNEPGSEAVRRLSEPDQQPAHLPLAGGHVACFTCHNPHQAGLFRAGSELDTRAQRAADAAVALRVDRLALCLVCHVK